MRRREIIELVVLMSVFLVVAVAGVSYISAISIWFDRQAQDSQHAVSLSGLRR